MSISLADWLTAVQDGAAAAQSRAGAFGQHVSIRDCTGSTNDDVARAALEGAPEGYTVIAGEQTAGRGRRGASWHSPAAHGLYLSTLLRPERWAALRTDSASPVTSLVTLMTGVAVVAAIRDLADVPVELKWPNDVMVRSQASAAQFPPWRKLAGILAEGASDGGVLRSIVVGVGINVWRSDAPPDVAARMVALDDVMPAALSSKDAVQALVTALLVRLCDGAAMLAGGRADDVREQWRRCAPAVEGTPVRWRAQGVTYEGHAAGIDANGALRVSVGGMVQAVHGGDVDWLLEPRGA